jgi:TRAP transporter 4TM/12TM fusion protein
VSDAALPVDTKAQPRWLIYAGGGTAVAHLYFNSFSPLSELWTSLLHFGLLGCLVALTSPVREGAQAKYLRSANALLGGLTLLASIYLIAGEDAFYARGQNFTAADWTVSMIAVICALELARRSSGWVIPILSVIALTYTAWWGRYVGGVFQFPGLSWETVLYRATYGGDGMFGTVARISWSYVFMFILFGTFLLRSGASGVILALARAAAGRLIGGPGFVAVAASGLMGSVSGSAIGNTVSTGVVTIPLMKRAGFPARTAAGIEAASSTGGQLMPPVMGAGAFLMANYTGESYLTIISVAAIPALLYFLSVAFQVRIVARKENLTSADIDENTVSGIAWPVLLPLAVLVGLLIAGFTPTWSAGAATLATVVCSHFGPKPLKPGDVLITLAEASFTAASIGILLIAVGLVIMAVTTTGLGPTMSQMIIAWSGGNMLVTLALVALASLVLGLGLPVTAAYVVLAPLAAPALADLILNAQLMDALVSGTLSENARTILTLVVPEQSALLTSAMSAATAEQILAAVPTELRGTVIEQGLNASAVATALLTAHLIVFWLSQDSNVTPPVCLTAYAAAGLAGTKPLETGFAAWAYAKGLYIIPLVMALSPLIGGDATDVLEIAIFTAVALYALTAALHGHLEGTLPWSLRAVSLIIGGVLIWPHGVWAVNVIAVAVFAGLFALTRRNAA